MNTGKIILLVAIAASGWAQNAPDARTLVKETGNALHGYHSYVIDQQVTVEMTGALRNRIEMPVKLSAITPGKLRIESNGQLGSTLIVSDGENTWMYVGPLKQYTKTPAASSPEALMKSLSPGIGQMLEDLRSKDPFSSAKIVGEETLETDGRKFECFVVEATMNTINIPGTMTLSGGVLKMWIDKNTRLTLKQTATASVRGEAVPGLTHLEQSITVTSLRLNESLPDSVFRFTPPEGSKEVPEFQGPVRANADLTGKQAADFKLRAMDGKEYNLQALRGEPVLIDFWATWCVPCRQDLPMLEKIQGEFGNRGLTMLGIDVGEDQQTVGKFLRQTRLSYPVLLAGDTDVPQNYSVAAFPTVVLIDKDGTIAMYHVGSGGERGLRAALAKLGLSSDHQPAK